MKKGIYTFSRFAFVFILFAILFSYAMFQGGFVSWFLFFSFLPIIIYSIVMLFYPLNLVQVHRTVSSKHLRAGQTVKVNVTIRRKMPFPLLFVVIEDQLPSTMDYEDSREKKFAYLSNPSLLKKQSIHKTILFPMFKREIVYEYELPAVPRGRHHLQEVKVVTGDLLGLVRKEYDFHILTELLVLPQERPLRLKNEISYFEEGEQTSYVAAVNKTNVVSGVRDYAPGDKVSWIDWKGTAKKQKLLTREFEQEKHKDLTIILNRIKETEKDWLAFEAGIELALSLVKASVKDHGRVGFVALGKKREAISIDQGNVAFDQLTKLLSDIQMEEQGIFSEMLLKESLSLSKDRNLVIITHDLNRNILKTLHQINYEDIKMSVIFIRSRSDLTVEMKKVIDRLKLNGINLTWLHEDQLTDKRIEVRT